MPKENTPLQYPVYYVVVTRLKSLGLAFCLGAATPPCASHTWPGCLGGQLDSPRPITSAFRKIPASYSSAEYLTLPSYATRS